LAAEGLLEIDSVEEGLALDLLCSVAASKSDFGIVTKTPDHFLCFTGYQTARDMQRFFPSDNLQIKRSK
jgi:hypothetical protein